MADERLRTAWDRIRAKRTPREESLLRELVRLRSEIEPLRAALSDIAGSGPVDLDGKPDADAGWSWCYERAHKALDTSPTRT